MVRDAVRSEWQAVTGTRRRRQRLVFLAAAASVVMAVAAAVNLLSVPSALPVKVAAIDKSSGSIYLIGDQAQLQETTELDELHVGDALGTGRDSRVSLAWHDGGSLRVDEESRVEFTTPGEIFLRRGRVYFDSQSVNAGISSSGVANFAIRTEQGLVQHLGTQYMTGIDQGRITVSVREGEVSVSGNYHDARARAGQQVTLAGTDKPAYTRISTHGELWQWVETVAPVVDVDKRSAFDFIAWVARETGLEVHYSSEAVEEIAMQRQLIGRVERQPRIALDVLLQVTDLQARIEDGRIIISER